MLSPPSIHPHYTQEGLDRHIDHGPIVRFFEPVGKVKFVSLPKLPPRDPQRPQRRENKGYAFVEFEKEELVAQAVALVEQAEDREWRAMPKTTWQQMKREFKQKMKLRMRWRDGEVGLPDSPVALTQEEKSKGKFLGPLALWMRPLMVVLWGGLGGCWLHRNPTQSNNTLAVFYTCSLFLRL